MCRAPEPEPARIVQRVDRGEHPVEVEQRLAHPHEHDVREPLAVARRAGARRGGPGRRSRRSRGPARTRARRSRRTGSRPRSRPGSRCTACGARAARRGPGSASGPTRSSAPSDSRWRPFSVRPPSERRSSVSPTVSNRNARVDRRRGARPAASGPRRADAASPPPDRVARPGGRGRRARPARRARPPARRAACRTGPVAGRRRRDGQGDAGGVVPTDRSLRGLGGGIGGLDPGAGARGRSTERPRIDGRPRRNASPLIGRPPAGWTSSRTSRPSTVARARPSRSGTIRPGSSSASAAATIPWSTTSRSPSVSRKRSGPRQVGPNLALEEPRRPRRVEPAVGPAERPGQRGAVGGLRHGSSSPSSHGSSDAGEDAGRDDREARLQGRRGLVARRA